MVVCSAENTHNTYYNTTFSGRLVIMYDGKLANSVG